MIIDIVILSLAVAVGLLFAFAASYLKKTVLLVPVRQQDPVPFNAGAPVPFRFTTYGQIKDKTLHRPRMLLALIVFCIVTIVLKMTINISYEWKFILLCSSLMILGTLFVTNLRTTILFGVFAAVCPFLLYIFEIKDPYWLLFSVGIIPGFKVGLDLCQSYHSLLLLQEKQKDISRWSKIYYVILKLLPLLIVYQVACYFFPSIDIIRFVKLTSGTFWQWLLLPFVLLITANIAWLILPIFRETLKTASIESVGEFTKEVRELEEKAKKQETTPRYLMALDRQGRVPSMSNFIRYIQNTKEYPKNQTVNDYLDSNNSWLAFQSEQLVGLLFITIVLLLRFFQSAIESVYFGNISTFSPVTVENITTFFGIAGSIALWVNIIFLVGLVADVLPSKNKDGEEEFSPLEANIRILKQAQENSELIVTSQFKEKEMFLQVEDSSILEQDAEKLTEFVDVPINDVTQKFWFKASSFLAVFGGLALLCGLVGHYFIGGNISDSDKIKFGAPGEETTVIVKGFESIGARFASEQLKITSPNANAIKSYKTEDKKWTIKSSKPEIKKHETPNHFSIHITCLIADDIKWVGQTIPIQITLNAHYPVQNANKMIEHESKQIVKDLELKIVSNNKWILHEISRYLMATGILTLIFFIIWIIVVYNWLKFKGK